MNFPREQFGESASFHGVITNNALANPRSISKPSKSHSSTALFSPKIFSWTTGWRRCSFFLRLILGRLGTIAPRSLGDQLTLFSKSTKGNTWFPNSVYRKPHRSVAEQISKRSYRGTDVVCVFIWWVQERKRRVGNTKKEPCEYLSHSENWILHKQRPRVLKSWMINNFLVLLVLLKITESPSQ